MSLPLDLISIAIVRDMFSLSNPVGFDKFYGIGLADVPTSGIISLADLRGKSLAGLTIFMNTGNTSQSWKGAIENGSNVIKLGFGSELKFALAKSASVYGSASTPEMYSLRCTNPPEYKDLYVQRMPDQTICLSSNVANDASFAFRMFRYDSNYRIFSESTSAMGSFETWPYAKRWLSYRSNDDRVIADNWYSNPQNNGWTLSGYIPASDISEVPISTTYVQRYPSVPMTGFTFNTSSNIALYGNGTYTAASTYLTSGREAWRAFDRDRATVWQPGSANTNIAKLTITIPYPIKPHAYRIESHSSTFTLRTPINWSIEGTNDGVQWTVIHIGNTSSPNNFPLNFTIAAPYNDTFYSSFRYALAASNALSGGNTLAALGEFAVYGLTG